MTTLKHFGIAAILTLSASTALANHTFSSPRVIINLTANQNFGKTLCTKVDTKEWNLESAACIPEGSSGTLPQRVVIKGADKAGLQNINLAFNDDDNNDADPIGFAFYQMDGFIHDASGPVTVNIIEGNSGHFTASIKTSNPSNTFTTTCQVDSNGESYDTSVKCLQP